MPIKAEIYIGDCGRTIIQYPASGPHALLWQTEATGATCPASAPGFAQGSKGAESEGQRKRESKTEGKETYKRTCCRGWFEGENPLCSCKDEVYGPVPSPEYVCLIQFGVSIFLWWAHHPPYGVNPEVAGRSWPHAFERARAKAVFSHMPFPQNRIWKGTRWLRNLISQVCWEPTFAFPQKGKSKCIGSHVFCRWKDSEERAAIVEALPESEKKRRRYS